MGKRIIWNETSATGGKFSLNLELWGSAQKCSCLQLWRALAWKGNRVLVFLQRNLSDCSFKVRAATTMVRPILQCAACTWDTYLQKDIQQLEQIQHRAAGFTFKNCYDRTQLLDFGWERLQERRKASRLAMLHKINKGFVGINRQQHLEHWKPIAIFLRKGQTIQLSEISSFQRTSESGTSFLTGTPELLLVSVTHHLPTTLCR